MKNLVDQLAQYAAYHRNQRNIFTHIFGIPLIVLAVVTLLSRPAVDVGGITLSPAIPAAAIAAIFYLRLDLRFGLAMALFLGFCLWAGHVLAAQASLLWFGFGLGVFALGWALQFAGHYFEGRKPAFLDDLIGLLIGPLFILAELSFLLGMRHDVRLAVQQRTRRLSPR